MRDRKTDEEIEVLRMLIRNWDNYADVTHLCAPAASEAYRRCARDLEQVLESGPPCYPLPL